MLLVRSFVVLLWSLECLCATTMEMEMEMENDLLSTSVKAVPVPVAAIQQSCLVASMGASKLNRKQGFGGLGLVLKKFVLTTFRFVAWFARS